MRLTDSAPSAPKPWLTYLLTAASVFFIAFFPFYQIRFGLDWGDTPYHILFYSGQRENMNVFTFVTPWVGRLWGQAFGFDVMSFRVLDMTCLILMHILPMILLFKGAEGLPRRMQLAAVGLVLAVNVTLNVFGYDSFSMLVFSLIFMSGYAFIFSGGKLQVVLLGLLSGLAVAVRFPNILVVFTLMLTITLADRFKGRGWRTIAGDLAGYLAATIAAYVLLFVAYQHTRNYEIPSNLASGILDAIRLEMADSAKREVSHTIPLLLQNISRDLAPIFTMTLAIGMIPMAWRAAAGRGSVLLMWTAFAAGFGYALLAKDSRMLKTMALMLPFMLVGKRLVTGLRHGDKILLAGLLVFFFMVFKTNVWDSTFRRKYLLFVTSASIVLCIGHLASSWKKGERLSALFALFCLMLAFNMPAGSNTGLWKSASIFTFTAPVVFVLAYRSVTGGDRNLMAAMVALLAVLSVVHKTIVSKTFMDGRMADLTASVDHPMLRGIHTTPDRKQNLEEMARVVDSVRRTDQGRVPVLTGGISQILLYMSGQPEPIHYALFTEQSEYIASRLTEKLKTDTTIRHVMLTYYYPETPRFEPDENLMYEKVLGLGFQEVRRGVNWHLFARQAGPMDVNPASADSPIR